jgi:hypothetical protein
VAWYPCGCVPVEECRLIDTPGCEDDASIYLINVSGLANSSCASCNDWNGVFNLKYDNAGVWKSDPSSSTNCGHTAGDPLWKLEYDSGAGYYYLTAVGLAYRWRLAIASWACNGTNALSLVSPTPVPAPCTGVPTTINAVPCTIECSLCSGTVPDTVSVTLSGWIDADPDVYHGCWCSLLNGTYVLSKTRFCKWETRGNFICSHWFQGGDYYISVEINYDDAGHVRLVVLVYLQHPLGGEAWITYVYDSGSAAAIDCEATYYPTHVDSTWHFLECGPDGDSYPVVQVN